MAKRQAIPAAPSQAAVATHFGVSERTVGNWFASGCPGEAGNYELAAIERWRREHRKRRGAGGSEDVWGERLKREKVLAARLARREREGKLIDRGEALRCWGLLAKRLQQAGAGLQKKFGPEAAKLMNQAIEDCRREVEAAFSDDGNTDHVDHDES